MSYTLLLLVLSLVVIVPTVFVVRGKSKQKLLSNKNQNQKFLSNTSGKKTNDARVTAEQLQIADTIKHYQNHPALPISFRQLLGKIHSQYLTLNSVKLSPDQRFTVDKLAGTRLSETLEDYLALDKDYAENAVIDKAHSLTSQDVTYGQLVSMLDFMNRAQEDGQAQVASNILANRSYLQSVYGEFHPTQPSEQTNNEVVRAPEQEALQTQAQPNEQALIERGISYLADCDKSASSQISLAEHADVLGDTLMTQLGELTYSAERTITYSEALLGNELTGDISLQAFDHIIAQAIPNLLRSVLSEQLNQHGGDTDARSPLSTNQQSLVEQKIARIQQLINDCLTRLERVAKQQYETASVPTESLQSLQSTIKSKSSQAQYLLDSGFFKI